jgi:hypothetical protein
MYRIEMSSKFRRELKTARKRGYDYRQPPKTLFRDYFFGANPQESRRVRA